MPGEETLLDLGGNFRLGILPFEFLAFLPDPPDHQVDAPLKPGVRQ